MKGGRGSRDIAARRPWPYRFTLAETIPGTGATDYHPVNPVHPAKELNGLSSFFLIRPPRKTLVSHRYRPFEGSRSRGKKPVIAGPFVPWPQNRDSPCSRTREDSPRFAQTALRFGRASFAP